MITQRPWPSESLSSACGWRAPQAQGLQVAGQDVDVVLDRVEPGRRSRQPVDPVQPDHPAAPRRQWQGVHELARAAAAALRFGALATSASDPSPPPRIALWRGLQSPLGRLRRRTRRSVECSPTRRGWTQAAPGLARRDRVARRAPAGSLGPGRPLMLRGRRHRRSCPATGDPSFSENRAGASRRSGGPRSPRAMGRASFSDVASFCSTRSPNCLSARSKSVQAVQQPKG